MSNTFNKKRKFCFVLTFLFLFLICTSIPILASTPTVTSFSPADDATGVSTSANLIINFDQNVTYGMMGYAYLKTTSGDTTIETFPVGSMLMGGPSARFSGWGTSTITIDPTSNLSAGTGYYIIIDTDAIHDGSSNYYTIASKNTWNFTTATPTPLDWLGSAWTRRIKIEINKSMVNGTVANFPVYIDLSSMPASLTDYCLANGADLRVTKSDGITEVAREVVFLNRTSNAGELHFVANGTLTNSSNGVFFLYYGNGTASEPAANATYGKYNVWAPASYVTVWHLNENPNSGNTLYNSVSASYNCTSAGTITSANRIAGQLTGNGTSFGGAGYLACGDVTQLNSATKFTITGWGKRAGSSNNVTMVSKCSTPSVGISSEFWATYYYAFMSAGDYGYKSTNDTSWHHYAMVFNGNLSGNANRLVVYNGGNLESFNAFSGTIPASSANLAGYDVWIGRNLLSSGNRYSTGRVDEIRIASVARNSSWIKTEYNNQNSPSTFYSISEVYYLSTPVAQTFSPADDYLNTAPNADLIITFDRKIDIQTGNVTIKKTTGDVLVETIDVTSGQVTGNGTTQITINPSANLAYDTSFYVLIDATAFDDTGGNSYAGIASTTAWNFTTVIQPLDDWLNTSWITWTNRVKIEINKSMINGSVANFPVYIDLSHLPAAVTEYCLANGADLRVTTSDGLTPVAREVVFLNRTTNAGELHFLASSLTNASNGVFYLYYNNPSASEPAANDTYGKYNVWTAANYAAVWHLNENPATGSTLYNSTSSSYNCTSTGTMTAANRITGLLGNGTSFGGSGYLDCGDVTALNSATKFTISGWAKRLNTGTSVTIASKTSSSTVGVASQYYTTEYYSFLSSSTFGYKSTNDTNWHNYTMIYNGSQSTNATKVLTYDNGTLLTLTFAGTIPTSTTNLATYSVWIGRSLMFSGYTSGRTDEVRIASVTRNGSWVKTEYRNQKSPSTFYSISTTYSVSTPVVLTLSPADDATTVATTANLVITFDRKMDIQTGNIYIKLSSGGSTFETIDVTSGQVTGNGTTQITINPSGTLSGGTGYYVEIDASAFDDTGTNSYAGIVGSSTTWNFTTVGGTSNMIFYDMGY